MHLPHKKDSKKTRKQLLTTVEYKHFQLLRIVNLFTLFLFGVILGFAGMFLYNKIYTVIGQAQNILSLERPSAAGNAINFSQLEKVDSAWREKFSLPPVTAQRDPFNPPEQLPIPSPTSTESLPTSTTES